LSLHSQVPRRPNIWAAARFLLLQPLFTIVTDPLFLQTSWQVANCILERSPTVECLIGSREHRRGTSHPPWSMIGPSQGPINDSSWIQGWTQHKNR
jgi:hypothetical protein